MKIHSIIAVSLAVTSFSALAFKSEPARTDTLSTTQIRAVEASIFSNFNSIQPHMALAGTCAASPVAGCGCPFCTMLRAQVR